MRTPCYELQAASRAVFGEFWGWELPERFGDPDREVEAVRKDAALFDLSFRGDLRVTGRDRLEFLQGMVTNDLRPLRPGTGCHAALLTPKGGVRTDLWVFPEEDGFRLEVDPARRDELRTVLERHIVAADVRIEDCTGREAVLSLQGPASADRVRRLFPGALPPADLSRIENRAGAAPAVITCRGNYTGEAGYEVRVPAAAVKEIWRGFREIGVPAAGMTCLEILRIEQGIPRAGTDMDESTLAAEVPLEDAINSNKGCYVGQEVIARIRDRGHPNRQFVGLRVSGEAVPAAGDPILDGDEPSGRVTSAVRSATLGAPLALGIVRREHAVPGRRMEIQSGGRKLPATVADLPFYRRGSPT